MDFNKLKKESQLQLKRVEIELTKDENISDHKKLAMFGKEQTRLKNLISKIENLEKINKNINETEKLVRDKQMTEIANEELEKLKKEKKELQEQIRCIASPPNPNDEKNAILEIRAGTGGDEAELFAADLFRMYCRFAEIKGYGVDISSISKNNIGGIKEVISEIKGNGAYGDLKFEGGVHRIQRIPQTEKSGRIHTSAATVAVLPVADKQDIEIKNDDLKIDTFRSSGHGGQSVNTTDSAVRITHIPTGVVVSCQDERSQIKNKDKAMKILRSRLLLKQQEDEARKTGDIRKIMVGSGDRSEKIRTYNFPQNRVTDHRINYTSYNLPKIMDGEITELIGQFKKIDDN